MALTQTQVSQLYVAIFNRASEGAGNTYWQSSTDMATCANYMLATTDAQTYFGTSLNTNQAFIEHIYLNTLNKSATDDPAGIAYWKGLLDNGMSRGEVVAALVTAVGTYASSTDPTTANAYNQFTNRVTVSNYMANTVSAAPTDYATSTSFSSGLPVTYDSTTVTSAQLKVGDLATPTYTMTAGASSVTEGSSVTFTVTSNLAQSADRTMDYQIAGVAVAGGTATPASDLGQVTGTVTILAGATTGTLTLTPTDDGVTEGFEGFNVSLLNSSFATVATSGNVVIKDGASAGQTFTLTSAADTGTSFTGTSGNDTYVGAVVADNGTGTTFNAADNLSGGAGTDTLNVNISGTSTVAVTVSATTLAAVENVLVSNFDTNADDAEDHDFNTALWTGVTTLGLSSSDALGDTKFSNVAAIATAEMKSGAGDLEIDYAAATVTGTADTQALVLNSVSAGTFTADTGIETVAITAASTASASTLTDLVATGATKITIDSDVALTITNALDATAVTVDGSASAGALSLNFTAAAADLAVTGGTGNDTFTFDATGTLTTADTISGGNGTDTIKNVSAQFEALDGAVMTKVTGIEALTISNAATATETLTTASFGSISQVNFAAGTAGTYTVNFATGGGTVSLVGTLGDTLTVAAAGTATTDTVTFTYGDATADANGKVIATTAVETLTINNTKAADTTGAITMGTASTGGATKVVFTGDKTMTVGAVTAATVDASALTSTAALVMTAASVGATSITGSANADTLYGIAASASTIDGGVGNDSITGGTAADNITANTGNDTVVGAGGNDIITGGDGNDSISVSGAAGDTNISGGAGNDTITFDSRLSALDTVDGGEGTDTIAINATDITALNGMTFGQGATLNGNISNIEKVSVGALGDLNTSTNILDMSRVDNINYIVLTADNNATSQISGMVDNSTVEFTGGTWEDGDSLTMALASTTGTNTLNLKLTHTGSEDWGTATAAGVEVINVNSTTTNAAPSGVTNTLGLTVAAATTLTVTGDAILDANESAINATTIDASANTGGFHVLGGSANQTITGTAAADIIDGGAGADTISGGTGADSLNGGTGADSITGGEGADTVTGGAGNDMIVLTETTATVDEVIINYSEAGANIDTVTGFATTSSGDTIQLSIGALEAVTASGGIFSSTTNFVQLGETDAEATVTEDVVVAGTGSVQVLTATATVTDEKDVLILSGATFSTADEVEDALEEGGSFALTLGNLGRDAANNAFIIAYSNGTDAKVAAVHIVSVTAGDLNFEVGNLNVIDLVTLTGISSIGSTTFADANFEWIA